MNDRLYKGFIIINFCSDKCETCGATPPIGY